MDTYTCINTLMRATVQPIQSNLLRQHPPATLPSQAISVGSVTATPLPQSLRACPFPSATFPCCGRAALMPPIPARVTGGLGAFSLKPFQTLNSLVFLFPFKLAVFAMNAFPLGECAYGRATMNVFPLWECAFGVSPTERFFWFPGLDVSPPGFKGHLHISM